MAAKDLAHSTERKAHSDQNKNQRNREAGSARRQERNDGERRRWGKRKWMIGEWEKREGGRQKAEDSEDTVTSNQ